MFLFTLVAVLVALANSELYLPSTSAIDEGIVGGVNATIEEHPWQLSLFLKNEFQCGASLIKPNIALTAAHCTEGESASRFKVRAGSTYTKSGGILTKVIKKWDHPKYNSDTLDYDVSVLLLGKSLPLSSSIKTIELQPVGVEVAKNTKAIVTGWGRLKEHGEFPLVLQSVEIPKVDTKKCKAFYRPLDLKISKRMDCYGYVKGKKDSCKGDSGGPIVVKGIQTGIVSGGYCGVPKLPGVYTKISNKEIAAHISKAIKKFQKL